MIPRAFMKVLLLLWKLLSTLFLAGYQLCVGTKRLLTFSKVKHLPPIPGLSRRANTCSRHELGTFGTAFAFTLGLLGLKIVGLTRLHRDTILLSRHIWDNRRRHCSWRSHLFFLTDDVAVGFGNASWNTWKVYAVDTCVAGTEGTVRRETL